MMVTITATISLETELEPEYYDPPKTEAEIIPYELQQFANIASDAEADTWLFDQLMSEGTISNVKIEVITEEKQAEPEAA